MYAAGALLCSSRFACRRYGKRAGISDLLKAFWYSLYIPIMYII